MKARGSDSQTFFNDVTEGKQGKTGRIFDE